MAIGGVKSKETRSYQKGKCNSRIFSTETTHALEMCLIQDYYIFPSDKTLFPCFLHHQLPSNPISHQLSPRECFYLLVISCTIFVVQLLASHTKSTIQHTSTLYRKQSEDSQVHIINESLRIKRISKR